MLNFFIYIHIYVYTEFCQAITAIAFSLRHDFDKVFRDYAGPATGRRTVAAGLIKKTEHPASYGCDEKDENPNNIYFVLKTALPMDNDCTEFSNA